MTSIISYFIWQKMALFWSWTLMKNCSLPCLPLSFILFLQITEPIYLRGCRQTMERAQCRRRSHYYLARIQSDHLQRLIRWDPHHKMLSLTLTYLTFILLGSITNINYKVWDSRSLLVKLLMSLPSNVIKCNCGQIIFGQDWVIPMGIFSLKWWKLTLSKMALKHIVLFT